MKYQQITVDYTSMVLTACSYLALAGAVWILLRLIQACFWLPRHLRKQNDVQKMLLDKVENYEKYIEECEAKERAMVNENEDAVPEDLTQTEKWKERRECLEMLKKELNKVRDGNTDSYDWDYLLEEDEDAKKEEENLMKVDNEPTIKNRDDRIIISEDEPRSEEKKEK